MKASICIFTAIFVSAISAHAKTPIRKVASERPVCYANIGYIGDASRSVAKEFEVMYLTDCLVHSDSGDEIKFPSSATVRGKRMDFEAKIKMNSIPFVFTQGDYEYHLFQGKIVGVTKQR